MHIAILHNCDHDLLEEDPGREAREDVTRVVAALAHALTEGSTSAEPVPVPGDAYDFIEAFRASPPDLVINLCESLSADSRGEMVIPSLLELLRVPYTGSSALALGLALHKHKAKELLRARNVPTPGFHLVERLGDLPLVDLRFPLIVKPAREDASVGVELDSVVHDRPALHRAAAHVLATFHQPALVEEFIPGREIYVPLLGNSPREPLPLSEIRFGPAFAERPNIVSYRAKWVEDSEEYQQTPSVPCELPEPLAARVKAVALAAFAALECRDYGRVDLRVTPSGEPYVIDINPNCDLHPEAGFARAARAAGMDYRALALRLVALALERTHGHPTHHPQRPGAARRLAGPNRSVHAGRGAVRAGAGRPRVRAE